MTIFVRLFAILCLGLLAVVSQWLAVALLWHAYQGAAVGWLQAWSQNGALAAFFAMQCVAALSGGGLFLAFAPARMRPASGQGLVFAAFVILFLPVGGQLLLAGILALHYVLRSPPELRQMESVAQPTFVPKLLDAVHPGGTARARSLAANARVDTSVRMTAMNAVRTVPPHTTESLLQGLLADEQDEIRLLAYGILDQTERNIMSAIRKSQASLERRHDSRHAAVDHARLADLYWELVYQGLVRGAVYRYTLDQARTHAREALAQRPRLAGMHFLLGRCALLLEDPQTARDCFQEARQCGMPDTRLATWEAEAQFLQRRLADVQESLQNVTLLNATGDLQAVVRYWQ